MKPVIDIDKEYGLVLEGGGAKGAYQIGVWKALKEAGVKIKGIAGTSVGGLNGALICMDNLEGAVHVWENLTYSRIMEVEDEVVEGLIKGTLPVAESIQAARAFLKNGGVDVTPLKELIADVVDPGAIRESPVELYVTTFNVDRMREEQIDMKAVDEEFLLDYLLATAYMAPVFKVEKLHGTRYVDGGATDLLPVGVLLQRDYKDLIVVRIYGIGVLKRVEITDDVSILEIAPKSDLGSILEFDGERSKRNIVKGYLDGMRAIYGLKGKLYYIDEEESELFYLRDLLLMPKDTIRDVMSMHRAEEPECLWARKLTEKVFPSIASRLKLGSDWTYQGLFLGMLEATAKMCRVPRNKIYTVGELMGEIDARMESARDLDPNLDFVKIIIGIVRGEKI